jgi:hypothetical protein
MRSDDLSRLSSCVKDAAIFFENGEVMWPFTIAAVAIDELADAGFEILGLDARNTGDSAPTEIALSVWKSSGLQTSRAAAHEGLARAEAVTGWIAPNILITWA